tara:strand:- start:207 stop:1115 length:909 start_codon:yes stop_codon:yes gene_type:complete
VFKVNFNHLENLESESIYIIREVISEFQNPVMLYSIGKDSAVMLHLAMKAFYPGKPKFPLMHIDTTWKFKEMIRFRNDIAKKLGIKLITYTNTIGVKRNINPIDHGSKKYTSIMKTDALKQAITKYKFDAAFGGARRDEEKSRAKERIFSFRDENHRWDPKNQRPELWNIFNSEISNMQSVRIFPLSNWTEIDIWQYILREQIPVVPLYFSKKRKVIKRNNNLIMLDDERLKCKKNEKPFFENVRFRTLGCYPLTGAIKSNAKNVSDIIKEIAAGKKSERQGRLIDKDQIGSMEKKKQEGYF